MMHLVGAITGLRRGWILWPLLVIFSMTAVLADYVKPDLKSSFIESDALSLTKEQRATIVDLITGQIRTGHYNHLDSSFFTRAIGIALKIDKDNKVAYILNATLKDTKSIRPIDGATFMSPKDFSLKLSGLARPLMDSPKEADQECATYLCWLAHEVYNGNDDASYFYLTRDEKKKLDWTWAGSASPGSSTSQETIVDGKKVILTNGRQLNLRVNMAEANQNSKQDKNSPILKELSKINSLVVQELPNGKYLGSVMEIIANIKPMGYHSSSGTLQFASGIGGDMNTSFMEARRYVERIYPFWEPKRIEISFGDKYSYKDGGSAATAFGLLMLSLFQDFRIDPNVAITGDLTVDGKIRGVGGVAAKVRGAIIGNCGIVIVPKCNESQISDMTLTYPIDTLWKVQIFSAETIEEAAEIIRDNRNEKYKLVIESFAECQRMAKSNTSFYNTKDAVDILKMIAKECPSHLSTRYLLQLHDRTNPKQLSVNGSLAALFSSTSSFNYLYNRMDMDPAVVDEKTCKETLSEMNKIKKQLNNDLTPLYTKINDYVTFMAKFAVMQRSERPQDPRLYNRYNDTMSKMQVALYEKRQSIKMLLKNMQGDTMLFEKLMKEGY